ncbi:MAG: Na(+)-translocating NADH-quinone reductase subunit C [Succinivibrionaceae bacterium]|nr:Na(+)-translocating NADH-quinone reductase subunit C [Succinivibrionaceae bacterium]
MASNKESVGKTFLVVFVLCLVCSIFVAGTTVALRDIQEQEKLRDKQANIILVSGLSFNEETDDQVSFYKEHIVAKMLDLQTGRFVDDAKLNPEDFDYVSRAKTKEFKHSIEKEQDAAGIRFRSKLMPVYVAKDSSGNVKSYILPFYGQGLWSTLYGLLAVTPDGKTVEGINFYDHGETPGLGGEISNPTWTAKWKGKLVYQGEGKNAKIVSVFKGPAPAGSRIEVDGISGATLTGKGVSNCMKYWLSDDAYGRFLKQLGGK